MMNISGRGRETSYPRALDLNSESVYQSLLYTVFQRSHEAGDGGMVVALTSATHGAGVSYVTRSLVRELAKWELNSVAQVSAKSLRKLCEPSIEMFQQSMYRSADNVCELKPPDNTLILGEKHGRWEGSRQYRRDCIDLLRKEFDYTLIDCPSLKESGDLLSMAVFLDGVILVSEANVTRREQLRQAERSIEAAHGKILGHIFNKRTYEIPDWIYRRL
jgi:hypothetical protein